MTTGRERSTGFRTEKVTEPHLHYDATILPERAPKAYIRFTATIQLLYG